MLPASRSEEDEHVGLPATGEGFGLAFADGRNERGVALQFTVDDQARPLRFRGGGGGDYLVDVGMLGAAFGRERQHGDAWRVTGQAGVAVSGGYGDVGQLVHVGSGTTAQSAKKMNAVFAKDLSGTTMAKKLDKVLRPGCMPMIWMPARHTSPVV